MNSPELTVRLCSSPARARGIRRECPARLTWRSHGVCRHGVEPRQPGRSSPERKAARHLGAAKNPDGAEDTTGARWTDCVLLASVQKVVPGVGLAGWPADDEGFSIAVTNAR